VSFKKTYKPYGRSAILIAWEAKIDAAILKDMTQFKQGVLQHISDKIIEVIIGYHSLVITYKKDISSLVDEIQALEMIYKSSINLKKTQNFIWEIPVCYDTVFGIDLQVISEKNKVEISDIIKFHSQQIYTVYFIGFLPGFLYLGGLNKQLYMPRKETPRLKVVSGSVAIGGQQTGVYPSESAGGWNIIGKTPVSFFDVHKDNPCFAKAGDRIQFLPISKETFYHYEQKGCVLKKNILR
jgi:inhibitor of KinA